MEEEVKEEENKEEVKTEEAKKEEVKEESKEEVKEEENKEEVKTEETKDDTNEETSKQSEGQKGTEKEELPLETVDRIHDPAAPPEVVILACSKTSLHFWPFPALQTVHLGRRSVPLDLTPFAAGVSIEDAAFLDGFDREGTTVGVACKGGVVLVVNAATGQLLHNVGPRLTPHA